MNPLLKLSTTLTLAALMQPSMAAIDTTRTVRYVDENTTTVNYFVTNLTNTQAVLTKFSGEEVSPRDSHTINVNETYNATSENPQHFVFLQSSALLEGSYVYEAGDKACKFSYWTRAKVDNAVDDGIRVHHSGTGRSIGKEEADCSTFIHAAERHYPYNSAIEFTIK